MTKVKTKKVKFEIRSKNDGYIGDPPEWWVSFSKAANRYYHLPCEEKWSTIEEILDDAHLNHKCKYCNEGITEEMTMLMSLQRMKVELPD